MKKYFLLFILALLCSYIYAEEKVNIRMNMISPQKFKSNGKTLYTMNIENNENIVFYDLELTAFNDDNLEIIFDRAKINKIEPKENIRINMEIINNKKYYFNKDNYITYKISNDEYFNDYSCKYTIKPEENFWFFIIMSFALILTVCFIIIFIKINKGEENAG